MQITINVDRQDLPLVASFLEELEKQELLRYERETAAYELERGTTLDGGLAAAVRESAARIAEAEQFVADNEIILTPPVTSSAVTTTLSAPLVITAAPMPDVVAMMRAFAAAKGLAAASAVLKEFGVPNVLSLSPEKHAAFAARVAL